MPDYNIPNEPDMIYLNISNKEEMISMTAQSAPTPVNDMSFEQSLKELEEIVSRLERGNVELERSISIYERGESLRKHCDELLKSAEAKVEKITLDATGTPTGTQAINIE